MLFLLISIAVPLAVYAVLPPLLTYFGAREEGNRTLLIVACLLFFVSWYVPSPLIHDQDTSFSTHFIGGGIFSALLWLYIKGRYGWYARWFIEAFSLFAFVSALGVANELFELLTVELHLTNLTLTDTNWDLLANTLGAASVFAVYAFIKIKRTSR